MPHRYGTYSVYQALHKSKIYVSFITIAKRTMQCYSTSLTALVNNHTSVTQTYYTMLPNICTNITQTYHTMLLNTFTSVTQAYYTVSHFSYAPLIK